jgi:hypothetical protein
MGVFHHARKNCQIQTLSKKQLKICTRLRSVPLGCPIQHRSFLHPVILLACKKTLRVLVVLFSGGRLG